jgi:anthranilate/para-aminobenzoate synthase component II
MEGESNGASSWQGLVNKPVYSSEGQEIGIVSAIQPQHLVVSFGPITPDKYLIPKSSIKNVERGIIYLNENTKFVEENYRFE